MPTLLPSRPSFGDGTIVPYVVVVTKDSVTSPPRNKKKMAASFLVWYS